MTLWRVVFALLVLWLVPSFAQDYSVPSQWGALEAVNTSYDEAQGLISNMYVTFFQKFLPRADPNLARLDIEY
ncbi:hypothetical protein QCA50_008143 [Cerrena zonata]|uniref:Uncharacterized protein n=1 Tax=Cerrena zonata TaxID=2478898 RepID=A0AAW0G545_9APHY